MSILHSSIFIIIIIAFIQLPAVLLVVSSSSSSQSQLLQQQHRNISIDIINNRWSNNNHQAFYIDYHHNDAHNNRTSLLSSLTAINKQKLSSSIDDDHHHQASSSISMPTTHNQQQLKNHFADVTNQFNIQNISNNLNNNNQNNNLNNNFICRSQFGHYRDPNNCAAYYICSFGIALHKNCSEGLYFSLRLQTCDWPSNVPCEQDYASLNAGTSMYSLVDETKSTTTTSTPSPLSSLNNYYSTASTSNNPTITLPHRNISELFKNLLDNKSFLFQLDTNATTKTSVASSTINQHYPTSSSKSSLKPINNVTNSHQLNTLEKHHPNGHHYHNNNHLSSTPVVDGFEISPNISLKSNVLMNKYIPNTGYVDDTKFKEINIQNFSIKNNQSNNQQFQKRQGPFEPYWPQENGYYTIQDNGKHMNPFTIYNHQPSLTATTSSKNFDHIDLHLISTNPYINDKTNNKNNQAIQTYFWLDNLPSLQSRSIDSDRSKRPYREQAYSNQYNQNIFRPYDLDGNKSLKKDHGTEPKLMAITTSTTSAKPWIERSVRRKIPEFYVKFVTADNISTPYMVVNDHSNQEMIQPSSKPTTTVPLSHTKLPRQNEVKKLNYEINERLLAPFTKQYQIKPDDSMAFKYKNNVGRDDKISNNYSSGFNRYSDDHHKSTTAAAFVHHHPQSTTIGQMIRPITTSRASTSRFRKKIIRKKKTNNQQISTIPSQPLSSAMAASSSSSKSNIYGHHHHPSTNLLTGTLVTTSYNAANNRNHDNNDNNKEQKLLRRNSRPPLYKTTTLPLNFVQDASPSSWTPSATPFRNLSPTTTTTTTPVPMIPLQSSNVPLAAEHFTTPKPSQRNRPQQINEHKNDLISSNKHNQNIDNVNQHLLMRSVDGDKSESLMLVPMLIDHDHKHGSHLNLAQYNSYVVMPTNNDQNHMINRNNQVKSSQLSTSMATNINKSDANNNKQYESLKNPIETLEEFIKKTIDKITSTTTTTTTRAPTINSATSSSATSITSTTTTTTTALPPTTSSPVPLTTVSHILKGSSTKEQVFKKIKAINGYRRNRKYRRPLISLNQQQQQHPTTKTLNITTTTYSQQHFNNNNSDNHGKHNDIDDVSLINHTNNNNSKLLFNLSDPSTISFYETIKNNHLDSTTNNHDNNQWSLTTTTTPSSPTTVVQSYHLLSPPKSPYKTIAFSPSPPTSTTSYAEVPKIVTPFTSGPIRPSHWNKFKNSRKIRLPSSPKTTSTTTTTTTTIIPTNVDVNNGNNFTDYNYYDYDNFNGDDSNGSDDHDNIHDDYHNNMLNEGGRLLPSTTSTTTTTTTTTTTSTTTSTIAPPLSSLSLSSNSNNNTRMTRNGKKPLIYLKNRPRPTIRRLVIKDPDDELNGKVIQASRPKPLFQQPKALITASKCDKRKCRLPDCRCGSSDIPGGLSSKQIPQLVMLTFDDAVNDLNWELYEELLNSGRKNPNGCPVKATFYVSHEWTDYGQVQTLYSRGHEIASHTISHRFGEKFSKDEWIKEINGQREILNLYGGVKFDDIRGMRAPFLQTGGNNMFEMLYETNFTYDSSLPVQENSPAFWPYTLDYSLSHSCNIPPCPTKSFPGVWEVGMVMWSDLRGGRCSMGDACTNPSDEDGVYEMLIKNFNRHYKNNRAPFSLYYHSAWFNVQHHRKGFIRFLDDILQNDDVYMTTTWQMLQWVREPVTLSDLDSFEPFKCSADKVINECTRPKICNVHSKQGSRTLRTCQECPTVFPWIGNTGFPKSKYG